jgi:hypothetical protein
VSIDSTANTFVVETVDPLGARTAASGDAGQAVKLPDEFTIKLVSGGATALAKANPAMVQANAATGSVLLFFPNSRGTPGVVEITTPAGETARVESQSPAEPFKRVDVVK